MTVASDEVVQWERRTHIRIVRGEAAALGELYDRHAALVHAVAARLVGEEKAVQEVVTAVFVSLWQHPEAYDPARYRLKTWLAMTTCDCVAGRAGRGGAKPSAPVEVDDSLATMSSRTRATLHLAHAENKDYRQAATELGITHEEVLCQLRQTLRSVADAADGAGRDGR
ncbi:sigma factor [Streptomyces sp. NPDC006296]|uniref:sigma factor n=1 Tax=Streptomyces sp. NPDC006296 TaxID=3156746 RepID=UPI0033A2CCAC